MNSELHLMLLFFMVFVFPHISCGEPSQSDIDYMDNYGMVVNKGGHLDNIPSFSERWTHHMQNIVRVDKTQYKTLGYAAENYPEVSEYDPDYPPSYGSVKAIWFHPRLNEVARVHGKDLDDHQISDPTSCGRLQHPSCDGTSSSARVLSYFPCDENPENGAWSSSKYATWMTVTEMWLCEWPDATHEGGHTATVMRESNTICGWGHYASYGSYMFQDCSGCTKLFTEKTHPILSGIHKYDATTKKVKFMTFVRPYGGATDFKVYVGVSNEWISKMYLMERELGTSELGYHYILELDGQVDICRGYFFALKVGADETFFYPTDGMILVHNEGEKCKDGSGATTYFDEARKMIWGFTSSATALTTSTVGFWFVIKMCFLYFSVHL